MPAVSKHRHVLGEYSFQSCALIVRMLLASGGSEFGQAVRHRLCPVCSTAFVAKAPPLPCVFHCLRG